MSKKSEIENELNKLETALISRKFSDKQYCEL